MRKLAAALAGLAFAATGIIAGATTLVTLDSPTGAGEAPKILQDPTADNTDVSG